MNVSEESFPEEIMTGKHITQKVLTAVYLAVLVFTVLFFWFFTSGSDAFGFSLLFLWILLPVTTLAISFLIGRHDCWGKKNWISPLVFGVLFMLAEYFTFSLANMLAFCKFNLPDFGMLVAGVIISVIGLAGGSLLRRK